VRIDCSGDPEIFLKFEAENREFANFLKSLEQFFQTVKGQNNCWYAFLTFSWWVLMSDKFKTIRIQIGKKYWDLETFRKS
jgi:hypothetical protein